MPLPCNELDEEEEHCHRQAVAKSVVEVVKQGVEEDRVTCGVQQCYQLMASGPENIMLCLLVQLTAALTAAVKIPLLLIRAFCQEHDIDLLHVQGQDNVVQLLKSCEGLAKSQGEGEVTKFPLKEDTGDDVGCIMIKYPTRDTSTEDDMVAAFIKQKVQTHTDPALPLPDLTDLTEASMTKNFGVKLKTKKEKSTGQSMSQVMPMNR